MERKLKNLIIFNALSLPTYWDLKLIGLIFFWHVINFLIHTVHVVLQQYPKISGFTFKPTIRYLYKMSTQPRTTYQCNPCLCHFFREHLYSYTYIHIYIYLPIHYKYIRNTENCLNSKCCKRLVCFREGS